MWLTLAFPISIDGMLRYVLLEPLCHLGCTGTVALQRACLPVFEYDKNAAYHIFLDLFVFGALLREFSVWSSMDVFSASDSLSVLVA